MDKEKKIGDLRKFSFSKDKFRIKEILDEPNITLLWTWNTGVCSHCKHRMTREVNHEFYRIEILSKDGVADKDVTIKDLQILGDTKDRRRMMLPIEKYYEVLSQSKIFQRLRPK